MGRMYVRLFIFSNLIRVKLAFICEWVDLGLVLSQTVKPKYLVRDRQISQNLLKVA